jgi:high-affinity Fe2+/Pb2+ permease
MGHDELIEALAREHRYRNVLVIAAVVGIVASAIVGAVLALGRFDMPGPTSDRLGMFVLPFAASMVIGDGHDPYGSCVLTRGIMLQPELAYAYGAIAPSR